MKTAREKYLTEIEFANLLKVIPKDSIWYMLYYLMGNLGLRVGEVVRLRVQHIDIDNLAIKVPTLKQEGIKGRKRGAIQRGEMPKTLIEIPVSDKMIGHLKDYVQRYKRTTWLFPYKDSLPIPEWLVRRTFKKVLKEAKLRKIYSPHSLRHCRGVKAYKQFKDIRAVQALLRHRNINSTVVYTHLDLDAKRELTDALEDVE